MMQELIRKYPEYSGMLQGGIIPEDVIDAELQVAEAKREESEENDMATNTVNNTVNGTVNNNNYGVGCSNCPHNCKPNQNNKTLRICISTSIICSVNLLDGNSRLSLVAEKGNNRYYHIEGSNSAVMHVEQDFCILLDYMVKTYKSGDTEFSLPCMLSARHYGVYQNDQARDWVKGTSGSRPIGHDIQDLVYGDGAELARKQGYTLDHGAETHNEKTVNCHYKTREENRNDGSHRIRRVLDTPAKLDAYIDAVIAKGENQGYII